MQSSYYYQCTATNQCPVYVVLLSLRSICRELLLAATTFKKMIISVSVFVARTLFCEE